MTVAADARSGGQSRRRLAGLGLFTVLTLVSIYLLRTFVLATYYIPSESMEPTLHGCATCAPDLVLVNKLAYVLGGVSRGDVVVFDRPRGAPSESKELIKRVIGLPGETISARDGQIYVDGRVLTEPYVLPACPGTSDLAPAKVPAAHYFMMGDNRCNSFDSRRFGPVTRGTFVGRAVAVVWPVKHLRSL
jgi:signal peptidase I